METTTAEHAPRAEKRTAPLAPVAEPAAASFDPAEIWGKEAGMPLFLGGDLLQRMADRGQVNRPGDPFEREAETLADRVVNGGAANAAASPAGGVPPAAMRQPPAPQLQREGEEAETEEEEEKEKEKEKEEEVVVQRRAEKSAAGPPPVAVADLSGRLQAARGGGRPLPEATRLKMESGFGADFSGVRLHTGAPAVDLSRRLQAQAFTYGQDIFFNAGKFDPGSRAGEHLLAHELTHTLQQSGVRRQAEVSAAPLRVQRFLDIDVRGDIGRFAHDNLPGYTLLTVIAEYDPIAGRAVARTRDSLLEGIFSLVNPWGSRLYAELSARGLIDRAFDWINAQLGRLNISIERVIGLFEQAWEAMDLTPALDIIERNAAILERTFTPLISSLLAFVGEAADAVLQMIKDALLDLLRELASAVPGYDLLVMILGRDPLSGEPVEASTAEIIEAFLLLIGADQHLEKMREHGALEEPAAWIDEQLVEFRALYEELLALFGLIWDAFSFESLLDPIGMVNQVVLAFTPFAARVFAFASTVASQVLAFIKSALLSWLGSFADEIPGFHLLTVILGRNPLTDEVVPRTVENIIRGFTGLIPGGEEQFQQMKQTGVIGEAAGRIEALIAELGFSWEFIANLFTSLWNAFSIEDLLDPIGAFQRILARFGEPLARLVSFVVRVVMVVIEFLLRLMNFPLDIIQQIIANAVQAFEDIKNDPIGFLKNLLRAVKEGFTQFFANILKHLLDGVTGWLFGQMADAGITPPADLSFQSILKLVLEILGISAERIWAKLAEKIGQDKVDRIRGVIDRLTGIWTFVKEVIERGPVAIWERIQAQLSNLWEMVLQKARDWIMTRIVEQVTVKLLSMLDPTGIMAVVNSFIAIYKAVESFIQYMREMLQIVNSFVGGVAEIARGAIAGAAAYLENALAQALPIAIGFLANQIGLGRLGEKIGEIIGGVREMVDRALDWLLDKAVAAGGALLQVGRDVRDAVLDFVGLRETFRTESGEEHSLSVGEQEDADLILASRPMSYRAFLAALQIDDKDAAKKGAKSRAEAIVSEFYRKRSEPYPPNITEQQKAGLKAKKQTDLKAILARLWAETTVLLAGQGNVPSGETDKEPIPIVWYKPLSLYSQVEIVLPELHNEKFTYLGRDMIPVPRGEGLEIPVGIDRSQNEVKKGEVVQLFHAGRGTKTSEFRAILTEYGFDWGGLDADHVRDLQFGGEDDFNNIWPLDSSANRSAGSRQNSQIVTYFDRRSGQIRTINAGNRQLTGYYFVIEDVRLES